MLDDDVGAGAALDHEVVAEVLGHLLGGCAQAVRAAVGRRGVAGHDAMKVVSAVGASGGERDGGVRLALATAEARDLQHPVVALRAALARRLAGAGRHAMGHERVVGRIPENSSRECGSGSKV